MNHKSIRHHKPLHRSWVRFLPYAALGALLISFKAASNIHSAVVIYSVLMTAQLSILCIYVLTTKLATKNNQKSN